MADDVCPHCGRRPGRELHTPACPQSFTDPAGPDSFGGSDEESHYMSQTRIISTKAEFEEEYGKPDIAADRAPLAQEPSEFTRQGQPEQPLPKQMLVVRRDLKMRKGKIISQAAHASGKVFFDTIARDVLAGTPPEGQERMRLTIEVDRNGFLWLAGIFTKICCKAESEAQLLEIYEKAKAAGLPCCLITDVGKTEFRGVQTHTAVAIGPAMPEDIDPITGDLDLW